MSTRWPCCIFALLILLASACADKAPEATPAAEETPAMEEPIATAAQDSVTYSITLSGTAEVPGPGDEDGSGTAQVTLHAAQGEVCYEITVAAIDDATAAHIHAGLAGASGAPVVDLNVATNGLSGCVSGMAGDLLTQIQENPSAYYLNVHTDAFPAGAVRGQLGEP